jgi:hypothetical protein
LETKDTIDFVDCGKLWCLKNAWKMGPLIRGFVKCEYFLTRGPMYYILLLPTILRSLKWLLLNTTTKVLEPSLRLLFKSAHCIQFMALMFSLFYAR